MDNTILDIAINRHNMASIIMGKNVWLPWRGQPTVNLNLSYADWLQFVKEYKSFFYGREGLLNYKEVDTYDDENKSLYYMKFFMFEIGWALWNEVMQSANRKVSATLILPDFNQGDSYITTDDCVAMMRDIIRENPELYEWYANNFRAMYPCVIEVPRKSLSGWNDYILHLAFYYQWVAFNSGEAYTVRRM